MAVIDKEWKRKLRINCLPDRFDGRALDVVDAETGEHIRNILSMVICLDATGQNRCEITYHEMNDSGGLVTDANDVPFVRMTMVKDVEIDDLTAFEIMDEIRREMR